MEQFKLRGLKYMNIAFLFGAYEKQICGVNRLIYEAANEILKQDRLNKYYAANDNWMQLPVYSFNPVLQEIASQQSDLLLAMNNINLLHSFVNPFTYCKLNISKVLTVHDLCPLVNDSWFNGDKAWKDFFLNPLRKSVEIADCVCAVSENTKRDIIKYYGISEDKIKVVYPGCFIPVEGKEEILPADEVLRKYGIIKDDYILSVCTIEPRKNIRGLISGFARFKNKYPDSSLKLVLCGKLGWDTTFEQFYSELDDGLKSNIVRLGYVSDSELNVLYSNAFSFAYVSFYEGFGLPILEALHRGCPVICSEISSMPEVGGDAVVYCNPYKIETIENAIEKLAFDSDARRTLKQKSVIQAGRFSYKKMASEMISIYNMFS